MLPMRATMNDLDAVCTYLASKPTGATPAETKAVVDKKHLDYRKLNALKSWGVIEDVEGKLKITELGRQAIRDRGANKSKVLLQVLRSVRPYEAIVERVANRQESDITASDVAAHWYEHFKGEVSDSENILNDQAVCFFQIAQGVDLGTVTIGRKGLSTRFEFDADAVRKFVAEYVQLNVDIDPEFSAFDSSKEEEPNPVDDIRTDPDEASVVPVRGNKLFVTHGKNFKILDQVKQIVLFGKFEPVIAMEHETSAKPVPKKVMDDMRECYAAVIHVNTDRVLMDRGGNEVPLINENVLIEIGAAMALYGDRFVLLVEEGVTLPSNLQGLYECRYEGSELSADAMLKLLKALNEF